MSLRHSRFTVACAAAVVGAAGCGGGPHSIESSISKQAYITRADATCGAMDARLAALGIPRRPQDFPPFARRAAPIIEGSLGHLRGMSPPQALAAPVHDFEAALGTAVDRMRQAGTAAQSGDAATAQRLGDQARQAAQEAAAAARRVGYSVCGRFPGF
jgi:hypothetical protein